MELTVHELRHIHEAVYPARISWYNLGLQLGVPVDTLDSIQRERGDNVDHPLLHVLKYWLERGGATWGALSDAFESPIVGESRLATELDVRAHGGDVPSSLRKLDQLPGVAEIWYRLGLQLEVRAGTLDMIERNYPRDANMCKVKMFAEWMRGDTNPTYKKLVRALAAVGKRKLAESVCSAQGISLSVLDATDAIKMHQSHGDHSPSLRELDQLPGVAEIWYRLGLQLGVGADYLDMIERRYPRDAHMRMIKMFAEWMRDDTNPTYKKLVRALAAVGKRKLAESVCSAQGISLSVLDATDAIKMHQSHEIPARLREIKFTDLEFGDQLGEGAFCVVYKGHWKSRDMDVAIKRVPGKINKTESEILSKLRHPCIIQFHGVVVDSPAPPEHYIITELAGGGSLYDLLHKKNYQPSQEESLRWAAQIAEGMKYLHQQKMMHRDLKSSNVLLTGEGNIKICDFGGAKHFDHTTKQTQTGTYRWMAPEVIMGEPVSLSSDVFSYAMLLYEIFTGKLPFADDKNDVVVSNKIMSGEVPPLPDSIESYLAKALKQCWNATPKARPSFHDILEILKNKDGTLPEIPTRLREINFTDLEFGDQLGEGAFGVVYRGHWKSRDMAVAIKRVPGKINKTESEILSKLRHPCIIQFHGVVVDSPAPPEHYIITELAGGGSLYDLLHKKNYQPSQEESLQWAAQIAEGMKYLHQQKMMHRDLKSSNVLLTGEGNIKICDFGGAKHFDHTTKQTQTGTYRWMAPEVIKGEPVSLSSDVFSYGMLLYEIFTSKLPFADDKNDVVVSNKIMSGEVPPLPDSIESYLAKALKQCWNATPKARPNFHDILEILINKGISPSVVDTAGEGGHSPSLYKLNQIPGVTTIWYRLGLQLGVRADDLDMIETNYADLCKIKMFTKWQEGDTNPTYEKLVRALAAVGERKLAESVCSAQGISPSVLDAPDAIKMHQSHGTCVKEGALPKLLTLLSPVVQSWDLFALQIGVPTVQISQIQAANHEMLSTSLAQTLEWWIANHHDPTYEVIISALDPKLGETTPVMNRALASQVRELMAKEQETVTVFEEATRATEMLQEQTEEMEITKPQTDPAECSGGAMPLKEVRKPHQHVKSQGETTENVKTTEYLRGVEVIAETHFIVKGRHSQTFKWEGHGLKLSIPEGALLSESVIYIKAGLAGQFELPSRAQLVSPIYWLYCDNNFQHPVTLELQHCAAIKHQSECSFIVAKCSQEELPYKFKFLDKGIFSQHSSHGSVEVKQFSLFGVVERFTQWFVNLLRRSYVAQLFYFDKGENLWQLDFIITWNLELCLTHIQQKYTLAVEGPHTELEFEKESISLAIPENGITENGWAIEPLNPQVITKQEVDSFKPGQRIPTCQLQIRLLTTDSPEALSYKLTLEGTKNNNFLRVTRTPDTVHRRKRPRQSESSESTSDGIQAPTLRDLTDHVRTTEWIHLGRKLGIEEDTLAVIKSNRRLDATGALMDVLTKWWRACEDPTWVAMVAALREIGEGNLARRLEDKFC